jgi:hypothetical protein
MMPVSLLAKDGSSDGKNTQEERHPMLIMVSNKGGVSNRDDVIHLDFLAKKQKNNADST